MASCAMAPFHPLTSIRSFSELLLAYEDNPAIYKEFLRIINTESERLTRLVNDVLDISRIEAGYMTVPEGPGLGVTVDEAKIAKYRV